MVPLPLIRKWYLSTITILTSREKVKIRPALRVRWPQQSRGKGSHHRFHRGDLRYLRHFHRRYPLLSRETGTHPVPENLRAYYCHAVYREIDIRIARHLRDRLFRELNTDVSLRVKKWRIQTVLKYPDAASSIFPSLSKTCAGKAMNLQSAKRKFSTKQTRTEKSWSLWNWRILMYRMNSPAL